MLFTLTPHGNVGNRMLIYMVAQAVAERLGCPVRFNTHLPEWGMTFDAALHERAAVDGGVMHVSDADGTTLDDMAARIARSGLETIRFNGFFQRFSLLREAAFYNALFPVQPLDIPPFGEDEIVINVRAGDILDGKIPWYPLVPPAFYAMLVAQTGLRPVLLGQLDDGPYVGLIRHLLPQARLIPSAGPMVDFNRLRHARHSCIAVSTFSWLAGWLSAAVDIQYPVLGFLHPLTMPRGTHQSCGTDLTPLGDERYRYHLFPLIYSLNEIEYLRTTAQLNPLCLHVTREFMAQRCAQAELVTVSSTNNMLAGRAYAAQYLDAAWSIALGHFASAREHYEQAGRFLGYTGYVLHRMEAIEWRKQRVNLARGKPALQSSVSLWSCHPAPAQDAAGAVSGEISEFHSFHTDLEDGPWWRVDLGGQCPISEIWLFNRMESAAVAQRAARLAVDIGGSETGYQEVYRRGEASAFGGVDGQPLIIRLARPVEGRFVRIRLLGYEYLHLNQVEVY